jgi:hypothetical protein
MDKFSRKSYFLAKQKTCKAEIHGKPFLMNHTMFNLEYVEKVCK